MAGPKAGRMESGDGVGRDMRKGSFEDKHFITCDVLSCFGIPCWQILHGVKVSKCKIVLKSLGYKLLISIQLNIYFHNAKCTHVHVYKY